MRTFLTERGEGGEKKRTQSQTPVGLVKWKGGSEGTPREMLSPWQSPAFTFSRTLHPEEPRKKQLKAATLWLAICRMMQRMQCGVPEPSQKGFWKESPEI